MKKVILFFLVALFPLALFISCSKELELEPQNSLMSEKQRQDTYKELPNRRTALLNGMFAELKVLNRLGTDAHSDFGLPSIALILDQRSDNMISPELGYNWFFPELAYESNAPQYRTPNLIYRSFYAYVKAANEILKGTDRNSEDPDVLNVRAQARAFRAWAYLTMVQMYQFTYQGNDEKLGIPMVSESMLVEEYFDNPRQKVKDVYKFIVDELEEVQPILHTINEGVGSDSHTDIDEYVVAGLLARAYLIMGDNALAAAKARYVIDNSGRLPYTLAEANRPNFYKVKDHNVLWGVSITKDDAVAKTGIVNWQSFTCFLGGNPGYALYVPLQINPALYESMGANDIRRNWWIDLTSNPIQIEGLKELFIHNGTAPAAAEDVVKNFLKARELTAMPPYTSIKFAPEDGDVASLDNSSDFPIMRIEEMYYIEAEAEKDQTKLETFVSTYREPGYTMAAYGTDIVDEIYRQRRIEFWGEMISFFDMMRLKKDMKRSDSKNFETADLKFYSENARFDVQAGSPALLMQFPRREALQNKGLVMNEFPRNFKIKF